MRILLIAPQPFYQERGTPIAVDLLLRVLSARGDEVHVATFHEGANVSYPGVTLHRIKPPPLARGVPPGFSLKKILCDAALFFLVNRLVREVRPQIIHAVEESVFFGWHHQFWHGIPYIYDMDSSLARQLVESKPIFQGLGKVFQGLENAACRHALMVIPVCDALADIARAAGAPRVTLLRDISLLERWGGEAEPALGVTRPVFMYVGNLEKYQGIDLLLNSWALATKKNSAMSLVIVGGAATHIEKYRQRAAELGVANSVHFLGPRPVGRLASLLTQADVLLSPRTTGNNTPMKIYSYLDAGKAVLATDLPTHTQVLTPEVARLAPAEPVAFGAALAELAGDAILRARLGAAAKREAQAKYSFAAFQQTLRAAYTEIESLITQSEAK
ncbi:MAG: glycosyltransferase [Verrucomicrobia bacterium]|nr:MAG: glycosyltransferase [Verrucomicrobiota bacterium]